MAFHVHLEVRRMSVSHKYTPGQTFGEVFVNNGFAPALVNCHISQCICLESPHPMLLAIYFYACLIGAHNFGFFYFGAYGIHLFLGLFTHALKYVRHSTLAHLQTEDIVEYIDHALERYGLKSAHIADERVDVGSIRHRRGCLLWQFPPCNGIRIGKCIPCSDTP